MRALLLGAATLALSAGAALAQAPNWDVYPSSGYAPYGYGYVPSAPLYNYAAPAYGYSAPSFGYSAPSFGYPGPAYSPPNGQPPVAGETAENLQAGSVPTQTARQRGSMYMSAKRPHHKTLKDNSRLQATPSGEQ